MKFTRKLRYIPLLILFTPFMGIIGFFAYIYSLWFTWWNKK